LYYFRVSLNGSHIVSWGCGEEDTFKGKAMFRLYEPSRAENKVLQIAVFRARWRKKVEAGMEGSPVGTDHESFRAIDDIK
jgi:hypothetical protein